MTGLLIGLICLDIGLIICIVKLAFAIEKVARDEYYEDAKLHDRCNTLEKRLIYSKDFLKSYMVGVCKRVERLEGVGGADNDTCRACNESEEEADQH